MKNKMYNVTVTALVTAIICVLSFISIPNPFSTVPFTLQVLAVAFAGYFLGAEKGSISVGVYIVLGLIGLPVFSFFSGGAGVLLSPNGGFLIGFLPLVFCCGKVAEISGFKAAAVSAIGLVLCHILGIAVFLFYSKSTFFTAFLVSSLPFLLKDVLCLLAARFLAKSINKKLKLQ